MTSNSWFNHIPFCNSNGCFAGKILHINKDENIGSLPSGCYFDYSTAIEDQQGRLWVGYLDEGLDQFSWDEQQQSLVKRQHIGYDPARKDGLLSNRVIQILPDSKGFLWIGHNGAGLNRLDPVSGNMESYLHDPNEATSLSGNRIWGLSEGRAGYIWAGEFSAGLNRLDPQTGKVKRFRHDPNNPNSLSNDRVKAIFVDSRGDLWIGTNGGLNRLDMETDP